MIIWIKLLLMKINSIKIENKRFKLYMNIIFNLIYDFLYS